MPSASVCKSGIGVYGGSLLNCVPQFGWYIGFFNSGVVPLAGGALFTLFPVVSRLRD